MASSNAFVNIQDNLFCPFGWHCWHSYNCLRLQITFISLSVCGVGTLRTLCDLWPYIKFMSTINNAVKSTWKGYFTHPQCASDILLTSCYKIWAQPRHSAVLFPIFVEGGLCCKITLLLLRILVNWESKLNGKTDKKYRSICIFCKFSHLAWTPTMWRWSDATYHIKHQT